MRNVLSQCDCLAWCAHKKLKKEWMRSENTVKLILNSPVSSRIGHWIHIFTSNSALQSLIVSHVRSLHGSSEATLMSSTSSRRLRKYGVSNFFFTFCTPMKPQQYLLYSGFVDEQKRETIHVCQYCSIFHAQFFSLFSFFLMVNSSFSASSSMCRSSTWEWNSTLKRIRVLAGGIHNEAMVMYKCLMSISFSLFFLCILIIPVHTLRLDVKWKITFSHGQVIFRFIEIELSFYLFLVSLKNFISIFFSKVFENKPLTLEVSCEHFAFHFKQALHSSPKKLLWIRLHLAVELDSTSLGEIERLEIGNFSFNSLLERLDEMFLQRNRMYARLWREEYTQIRSNLPTITFGCRNYHNKKKPISYLWRRMTRRDEMREEKFIYIVK